MMPGEKPKNFKETMLKLLHFLKPYSLKIAVVIILAIGGTVFSIVSPMVLGKATDVVADGVLHAGGVDFEKLAVLAAVIAGLYLISFVFTFLQSFIMAGVSQKITYELRRQMSEKTDRLPLKYFDGKTHGEILSRFTNDIETVNQSLAQSMTQIITSFTTIVGILVMMLYISVPMTVVALIVIPASSVLIKVVISKSQKHFKNQQKYLGELNGYVEEMYSGHQIIKAFNREQISKEEFEKLNDRLYDAVWHSQFFSGSMMPLTALVGNLAYVFICVVGGLLALRGTISIGNIQAFIQYSRSFNQPITQIANVANILQSTAAAVERVFEYLEEEEEKDPSTVSSKGRGENGNADAAVKASDAEKKQVRGKVTFEHVRFGYDENILINDFNFEAEPGQRIAIVGHTGAGKTTLVKLMMRFYELNGGRILIDDRDILDYSRHELRSLFGMVLQDTWLFDGTVMDNIRYGDVNATDEQVIEAAKSAHIHHFIMAQPGNYRMRINEDASNISQGQEQLLTIARAFVNNAPILILDEATSSVDTRTEQQIQSAMQRLMAGRTSFIIAHRLSTIRDADVILVIDDGDIVEKGTHEELLKMNGAYAKLYNSQF
ncbi:MAG: ABC transporter ATP-binding protein/permease [Clostridia bacterium]|nr:ABC transporter ATP-binding protein/permease [Clostridia bacterium]